MLNPFTKLEKQDVIGMLKATGSRDKDVLQVLKKSIRQFPGVAKIMGIVCIVTGILACIPIITAIIGIPLAVFGWWIRRRAIGNIETIDVAYAEYVAGL